MIEIILGKLMKFIKLIMQTGKFIKSTQFISIVTFLAVAVTLSGILSSKYFLFESIIENGISKKDIIAEKEIEVVDTIKTEQMKREIAQRIEPILTPAEDSYIKNNLRLLEASILQIRAKNTAPSVKFNELSSLFDIQDSTVKNYVVNFFLNAPKESVDTVLLKSGGALDDILKTGISEKEFEKTTTSKIIQQSIGYNLSKGQAKALYALLEQVVVPNMMVDEYATDVAKRNAMNIVKPYTVTFKKGDKIVFEGEPVTQLKRDALKKAGYSILELNKQGIVGIFIFVCMTMFFLIFYIKKYEKQYASFNHLSIITVFSLLLASCAVVISTHIQIPTYMMLLPAYTIIIAVFTNPRVSLLASTLILALFSVTLFYTAQDIAVFFFSILAGGYSISKINYSKRFDLIGTGIKIGILMAFVIVIVNLFEGRFANANIYYILSSVGTGFSNGLLSGILALGILPIVESFFKIVTPYGLVELADHNQPLLSKLQYKAPGTYHHSLMVANLCEAAAEAIGANPILARVGAFYHDIGKLKRPLFFIENQSYFGIENPHQKLNPRLSKMVITAHTKDGMELAKEYGIPRVVADFIQQHHGESLAGYFYNQAVKEEGEGVSPDQFRYAGPKPNSKETAILMLADAVESAVRSLKNPTQDEIEVMINSIITERLNDGQLSDSPLTLKDIKTIAATFNRILRGMQHDRIKYQENVFSELEDKANQIKITSSPEEKIERRLQERRINKRGKE